MDMAESCVSIDPSDCDMAENCRNDTITPVYTDSNCLYYLVKKAL